MAGIKLLGADGTPIIAASNTGAMRVAQRPHDLTLGGRYKIAPSTGIMAAGIAGASEIFQFRWLSPTHNAKIRYLRIRAHALGTAFAAGTVNIDAIVARGWSAVGTGGGVVLATGDNLVRRASALPSQMATASELNGSMRIATTAALGAGTKTLDTAAGAPYAALISGVPNTAFWDMLTGHDGVLIDHRGDGEEPLTLAGATTTGDGFVIRVTVPATGTWTAAINLEWDEVPVSLDHSC